MIGVLISVHSNFPELCVYSVDLLLLHLSGKFSVQFLRR